MKILIIADVHANLAALESVLETEKHWDEVLFLGDAVIGGPEPEEAVAVLRELHGVAIMGNHDRQVLQDKIHDDEVSPDKRWIAWTREQLSDESLSYLGGMSDSCVVERDTLTLRLHHGDMQRQWGGRVWPDTAPAIFEEMALDFGAPYVLLAHSHIQFRHDVNGPTPVCFVNPGSVGAPRLGQPLACYAVLEGGAIRLNGVPYDAEATAKAMDGVPLDRDFIEEWKDGYRGGFLPSRYRLRDWTPLREAGYR